MSLRAPPWIICGSLFTALALEAALPQSLQNSVATLKSIGPEGQGNAAAQAAWAAVSRAEVAAIPDLLAAMDDANDYSLNWLRAAVETISQRALGSGQKLPVGEIEAFLLDPKHHPRARRMAYELLLQAEPERAAQLLPRFTNDPANELRRDAVQLLVDGAASRTNSNPTAAVAGFREALGLARDPDQIDAIAKQLGELGAPADLSKTFGWVTRWKMIGPFDNTGGTGFAKSYPPEETLDFSAEYDGKNGKARWVEFESKHDYGWVDFNQPFTPLKEAAGYAAAEFWSDTARPAELRLGCKNGWKVWLNGQFLFGRDEYHRGAEIDQYRMPVELKAGRNIILVKCTQNEQTEDWTKEWEFQLRVTDAQGTPLRSTR